MTNPIAQGPSDWARTTRFAELAWGMPKKRVRALFATTHVYPRYEGRNPPTGERGIVPHYV